MEFLKAVLGEEFYKQFVEKVNAYNGDEANKDKQIKLGNLASGEYVGKGKFDALQEALNGKDTELTSANDLIAQLKKDTKGNEDLQGKITQYEQQNAQLQAELQETKLKSAIKVALMSEKAIDVDYLTFKLNEKLKEKGETLELDENDNIKGWSDKLSGLKTQFPTMFESGSNCGDGYKPLGDGKIPGTEGDRGRTDPKDLAEALQQQFEATTK
nr:MAG TPA: minor structural protein [Caudoviricetes sp.]